MSDDRQRSVQEQYGRVAENYATSTTHAVPTGLVQISSVLAPLGRRFAVAVDVGTGAGHSAFDLAPLAEKVFAADITPEMLEQVRRLRNEKGLGNVATVQCAAESLPFEDGSVDLVASRTAAHHFTDVTAWLAESARVLRAGGMLALADTISPEDESVAEWMHRVESWRDPSHGRNYSASQWARMCESAGLRVMEMADARVDLEFDDWVVRAGMEPESAERLRNVFLMAGDAVRADFGIAVSDAGVITFHWPMQVILAEKPAEPTA
jgi:ubiquinone/menaquinone biosynthesis C-methylase UbiE